MSAPRAPVVSKTIFSRNSTRPDPVAVKHEKPDSSSLETPALQKHSDVAPRKSPPVTRLYAEDIAANPRKRLMLVKVPPGLDPEYLIGKKISTRKKKLRVEGPEGKISLMGQLQGCEEPESKMSELNKWTVFLPSQTDKAYKLVARPVEGIVTITRTLHLPEVNYQLPGGDPDD